MREVSADSELLVEKLLGEPAPRVLPEDFKKSRLYKRRKSSLRQSLIWGAVCIALSFLPAVKFISLYLVLLKVLPWVGMGIIVFAMLKFVMASDVRLAREYFVHGEVGRAVVLSISKVPSFVWEGNVELFTFEVEIEQEHPETGLKRVLKIRSKDYSAFNRDFLNTLFRVGDEVLVIWLPGDYDGTITIIDFLEAFPNYQLAVEEGVALRGEGLASFVFPGIIIFSIAFAFYAFGCLRPIDFSIFDQGIIPLAIGVSVGGVLLLLFHFKRRKNQRVNKDELLEHAGTVEEGWKTNNPLLRYHKAVVITGGVIFLSASSMISIWIAFNALADRSEFKEVPVSIVELVDKSSFYVIRDYTIKYRFEGERKIQSMLATPSQLKALKQKKAVAVVRRGRLGLPWVSQIKPVQFDVVTIP